MVINKKLILLFTGIAALLSLQFQCSKRFDCAETKHSFSLGIRAFPDKDSIHIGDTIWLEINEPTTLMDGMSGAMVDYSGAANLGTAISFAKLISINTTDDKVASDFKYVLFSGTELHRPDTIKYREYSFAENNNSYRFKLAIIPKAIGVYKLFVSNAANVYRHKDQCTKAGFALNFKETNQHFYFNKVSFPDVTLTSGGGVYLFKVM